MNYFLSRNAATIKILAVIFVVFVISSSALVALKFWPGTKPAPPTSPTNSSASATPTGSDRTRFLTDATTVASASATEKDWYQSFLIRNAVPTNQIALGPNCTPNPLVARVKAKSQLTFTYNQTDRPEGIGFGQFFFQKTTADTTTTINLDFTEANSVYYFSCYSPKDARGAILTTP